MKLLADAARAYAQRGWVAIPLGLDSHGLPKRPLPMGWPTLTLLEALALPEWSDARGIGLVLGTPSNGLAVLDLDDSEMASAAFALCSHTRCVRTIRKRGHIYVVEDTPSSSTAITVQWHGRQIKVELKATGTQVASPPTLGYEVVSNVEPKRVPSVGAAWEGLAAALGIVMEHQRAGYPPPWQEHVPDGERNQSAFMEAHRLREAGLSYALALEHLRFRWETHYQQGGQTWEQIERTIRSAYRKRVPPVPRSLRIEADHGIQLLG